MGSVQIKSEIKVGIEDILAGIAQLDTADLEQFADKVSIILANRKTKSLSAKETDLLNKIANNIPLEKLKRQRQLLQKIQSEEINPDEKQELEGLTHLIEVNNVEQLKNLIALAQFRKTNLQELMRQLGINLPKDV